MSAFRTLGVVVAVWLVATAVGYGQAARPGALSLDVVARAADAHDVATLKRAFNDPNFLKGVAAEDQQAAIDMKVAIAEGLAQGRDIPTALLVYQSALADVAKLGANDPQAVPMLRRTAALRTQTRDLPGAAADLDKAMDIAQATMDEASTEMVELKADDDKAWAAVLAADPTAKRPLRFASRAVADQQFDKVEIYYATHRKPTGSIIPARFYGGDPGPLTYGKAYISVPRNRAPGAIPVPSIFRLEFRADPEKHVILTEVHPITSRDAFFSDLSGRVGASQRKEVFVFIHGFNATFEQASLRTGQMAADLGIDGAPILYSWPSKGNAFGYRADSAQADVKSQIDDLANFITDVAQKTGAMRVHLVAHSLGNKFLMNALTEIASRPAAGRPVFDEIVMAAPDVAADDFTKRWEQIRPLGKRYTVYASSRDFALLVSDNYNRQSRLGDARKLTVLDGLQTIDTTQAKSGLLGHADFDGNALDDFRSLIWDSLAPSQRCVLEADVAGGKPYWAFAAGDKRACSDKEFREVVSMVRRTGSPTSALAELQTLPSKPDALQQLTLAGLSLEQLRQRLMITYGLAPAPPRP